VQAREARLAAVLEAMAAAAPNREPAALQAFRDALAHHRVSHATGLIPDLERAAVLEEAYAVMREARRELPASEEVRALTGTLASLATQARARREALGQLDARRTAVRFAYAKRPPALDFESGDLHRILLTALRAEGLLLALDLGHHPRPLLQLGPPLPAGVGGEEEWGEAVFRLPPGDAAPLLARLALRLPEGLALHRWEEQPSYATAVAELAEMAEWRWACPADQRDAVRARVQTFLAAERFPWDRSGKVGGQKQEKSVDLRPLVAEMVWEGPCLRITTPMQAFGATNPLKALGAILGLAPDAIHGLVRTRLQLRADPRLAQGERFEPKLRNLYEDAVMLSGGSNITIIEDEDDEPTVLG
jgi:radical SAM-linked protein